MHQDNLAGVKQAHLKEYPRQVSDQEIRRVVGDLEAHDILYNQSDRSDLYQRVEK